MWLLYSIISEGDVIVAHTSRKLSAELNFTVEMRITRIDYDKVASVIRVSGKSVASNHLTDTGLFHSLEIEMYKKFHLKKKVSGESRSGSLAGTRFFGGVVHDRRSSGYTLCKN